MWCTSCRNCCAARTEEAVVDVAVPPLGLPPDDDIFGPDKPTKSTVARRKSNGRIPKKSDKRASSITGKAEADKPKSTGTAGQTTQSIKSAKNGDGPVKRSSPKTDEHTTDGAARSAEPVPANITEHTSDISYMSNSSTHTTSHGAGRSDIALPPGAIDNGRSIASEPSSSSSSLTELPPTAPSYRRYSDMTVEQQAQTRMSMESIMRSIGTNVTKGVTCYLIDVPQTLTVDSVNDISKDMRIDVVVEMDKLLQDVIITPQDSDRGTKSSIAVDSIDKLLKGDGLKSHFPKFSTSLRHHIIGLKLSEGEMKVLAFDKVSDSEMLHMGLLLSKASRHTPNSSTERGNGGGAVFVDRMRQRSPQAAALAAAFKESAERSSTAVV